MGYNGPDSRAAASKGAVLAALLLLGSTGVSGRGSMVAYWGQGVASVEGTLADACKSGNYDIVILAFVAVFGNSQTPQLNLAGHCDPSSGGCRGLSSQISTCQSDYGVKVLLSLGGGAGSYELVSAADAEDVANYLWDNYLGGHSSSRPLGAAVLDGIDLDIEGGSPLHYDTLAKKLKALAHSAGLKLYLSAAPQCPFPDAYDGPGAGTALQTGLIDYVWIQFYNNYCEYQGGFEQEMSIWDQWASALPGSKIFMGLPAASNAAGSGYVESHVVVSTILPRIKKSRNYGGIMLWSVYYDQINSFSSAISSAL